MHTCMHAYIHTYIHTYLSDAGKPVAIDCIKWRPLLRAAPRGSPNPSSGATIFPSLQRGGEGLRKRMKREGEIIAGETRTAIASG